MASCFQSAWPPQSPWTTVHQAGKNIDMDFRNRRQLVVTAEIEAAVAHYANHPCCKIVAWKLRHRTRSQTGRMRDQALFQTGYGALFVRNVIGTGVLTPAASRSAVNMTKGQVNDERAPFFQTLVLAALALEAATPEIKQYPRLVTVEVK